MRQVLVEIKGAIGTITLNNDQKRNALSRELISQFIEAFELCKNNQTRVVVLRANRGVKVWSAGHDITELTKTGYDPLGYGDPLELATRAVREYPGPVLALIEGTVWGGACELVLSCDIPMCTPEATFALTPARLGVPYNPSGILRILSEVDTSVVKEMFFTARPVPAERALDVGLINHILPSNEIESFVYAMAEDITHLSPLSISIAKEQIRAISGARPLSPEAFERIASLRRKVFESQDYQEGVTAFLEKRKPKWKGM